MAKDSRYEKHQRLVKETFLVIQQEFPSIRLFERHVGMFMNMRGTPIKINQKGMADAWFIYPSKHGLLHGEMEFKTGASRLTTHQKSWKKQIESMNGIYILVRDKNEALNELKEAIARPL